MQRFGAHLLHSALGIKPFGLPLVRGPHGTGLLMSLHPDATPRESIRSRSLRRVEIIDGVRADGSCKIGDERAEGLPCKIDEERVDGLPHKIVEKRDDGKIEEELVGNELMGSTEKRMFESRITDPWCGSRATGWRVAAERMTALIGCGMRWCFDWKW